MRVLEVKKKEKRSRVVMRTLCDACESAAAVVFCAADEAYLCRSCDDKVHLCNKLASRHVRVGLADPIDVPRCDVCETTPAFFHCEMDGSTLCLQCDMALHVGGKRSHKRYLLFRQRVEFPGDKVAQTEDDLTLQLMDHGRDKRGDKGAQVKDLTLQLMDQGEDKVGVSQSPEPTYVENLKNDSISTVMILNTTARGLGKRGTDMFDLNMKPYKIHGETSNHQEP